MLLEISSVAIVDCFLLQSFFLYKGLNLWFDSFVKESEYEVKYCLYLFYSFHGEVTLFLSVEYSSVHFTWVGIFDTALLKSGVSDREISSWKLLVTFLLSKCPEWLETPLHPLLQKPFLGLHTYMLCLHACFSCLFIFIMTISLVLKFYFNPMSTPG